MARRCVFISYAREDAAEVQAAAALLTAGGVQVFLDVQHIGYGERWEQVLDDALRRCERVLVFWSLAAQASQWVEREWRTALGLGKRIVPTLLDTTPLPPELAAFQALPRLKPPAAPLAPVAPAAQPPGQPSAPPPVSRRRVAWVLPVLALAGVAVAGLSWRWFDVPYQGQPVPGPPGPPGPAGTGPWPWLLALLGLGVLVGGWWAWRSGRRRSVPAQAAPASATAEEARRFVDAVFAE